MSLLAIETDETLLILKIAFLVLLYGFIVLVVRSATRGMEQAPPQESIVLGAAEAAAAPRRARPRAGETARADEPELAAGARSRSRTRPSSDGTGRAGSASTETSSRPAVTHGSSRADGVWLDDLGSTNGTFVNGKRLERAQLVRAGDVIRVGETELQVQP